MEFVRIQQEFDTLSDWQKRNNAAVVTVGDATLVLHDDTKVSHAARKDGENIAKQHCKRQNARIQLQRKFALKQAAAIQHK